MYAPATRVVIEQLHRCQLISVAATGDSTVDVEAAADANISVCAIDENCTEEFADHVILLMLVLCRRLPKHHDQMQRENLWKFDSPSGLTRMRDMTLGIVGFGKIGQPPASASSASSKMRSWSRTPHGASKTMRADSASACLSASGSLALGSTPYD